MKIFNSILSAAVCIATLMPIAQASAEYDRHYAVGKDFLNREQYKLAVDEFTQALRAANSATALVDRGTAYSELKKYDAAINDLNQAIKIDGKRAYELARAGIDPKLKPRKVTIHDLTILDYSWPLLKIRVKCGSGTYIRSLAQDIGEALGVGAYLTALRRTKIGEFDVKDASPIGDLAR